MTSHRAVQRRGHRALQALAMACVVLFVATGSISIAGAQPLDKAEQAAALSHAGMARAKEKRFDLCFELFRQAWSTDKSTWSYLYSAARCAEKAGKLADAEPLYYKVSQQQTDPVDLAMRAKKRWLEVRTRLGAQQAKEQQAQRAKQQQEEQRRQALKQQEKRKADAQRAAQQRKRLAAAQRQSAADHLARQRMIAWTSTALGIIAAGAGTWLTYDGLARGEQLRTQLGQTGPSGKIAGINRTDALAAQTTANRRVGVGAALTVGGVAAIGAGLWLLQGPADNEGKIKASLLPLSRGLAWRVRW